MIFAYIMMVKRHGGHGCSAGSKLVVCMSHDGVVNGKSVVLTLSQHPVDMPVDIPSICGEPAQKIATCLDLHSCKAT